DFRYVRAEVAAPCLTHVDRIDRVGEIETLAFDPTAGDHHRTQARRGSSMFAILLSVRRRRREAQDGDCGKASKARGEPLEEVFRRRAHGGGWTMEAK